MKINDRYYFTQPNLFFTDHTKNFYRLTEARNSGNYKVTKDNFNNYIITHNDKRIIRAAETHQWWSTDLSAREYSWYNCVHGTQGDRNMIREFNAYIPVYLTLPDGLEIGDTFYLNDMSGKRDYVIVIEYKEEDKVYTVTNGECIMFFYTDSAIEQQITTQHKATLTIGAVNYEKHAKEKRELLKRVRKYLGLDG